MTNSKPAALMSYVHSDDKYKQLTTLRERLSDEIGMQLGIEFPIFQDTKDIQWGQNWEQRINSALTEEITFLIPIITPRFFNSGPCRDELERFLEVEKKLKRNDLILPIYFVDTPLLNDPESRATNPLAEEIASRQYADWRDLRFEPFTNPQVGKRLAQLASQIRDALPTIPTTTKVVTKAPAQSAAARTTEGDEQPSEGTITKTEPPTCIVDPMHRGHYTLIAEAIKNAEPGTRILVRKGLYREDLILDKPLEIIGDGDAKDVVIESVATNVILFQTTMGRVVNLTLRQMRGGNWYCVQIAQGRLELEDCDISSQGLSCVAIHGGADPRLRRNRIHDSKSGNGVFFYENAQGTLEDNDIFGNSLAGVSIKDASNPTVRRNRIHNNSAGLHAHESAQGTVEDNEIFGNTHAGVQIRTSGKPILRRNRIYDNKQSGVVVVKEGRGVFEENDIFSNGLQGFEIKTTGDPIVKNNRINHNLSYAVRIDEKGRGTFENNDLTENTKGAWSIAADSEANVKRANNKE